MKDEDRKPRKRNVNHQRQQDEPDMRAEQRNSDPAGEGSRKGNTGTRQGLPGEGEAQNNQQ